MVPKRAGSPSMPFGSVSISTKRRKRREGFAVYSQHKSSEPQVATARTWVIEQKDPSDLKQKHRKGATHIDTILTGPSEGIEVGDSHSQGLPTEAEGDWVDEHAEGDDDDSDVEVEVEQPKKNPRNDSVSNTSFACIHRYLLTRR